MKVCNLFFFLPVAQIKIDKVIAAFSLKCHAIPALKISAEFSLCCQVSSREKGFKKSKFHNLQFIQPNVLGDDNGYDKSKCEAQVSFLE